jgi:hypothetical protein
VAPADRLRHGAAVICHLCKSRAQVDFAEDARNMLTATIEEELGASPQVVATPKLVSGDAAPVLIEASRDAARLVVGGSGHGGALPPRLTHAHDLAGIGEGLLDSPP